MKRSLLSLALVFVISNLTAQITWTGNGANTNWNNSDNWDSNTVPTSTDVVIIPTNYSVFVDPPGASVLSLDLQGNSTINITNNFNFVTTFNIAAAATVEWNSGHITSTNGAVGGTVFNDGTINLYGVNGELGTPSGITVLDNDGDINMTGIGDLLIYTGSVVNNNANATINLNSNATGISRFATGPHILNNNGIINNNPPLMTDQNTINVQVNNNPGGTIVSSNGTLFFAPESSQSNMFNGGTYNVLPNAIMRWNEEVFLSGVLGGNIQGTLILPDNLVVNAAAALDFSVGAQGLIDFNPAVSGGGTLTNNSVLTIGAQPANIQANTTLVNTNRINFIAQGDLTIVPDGTLENDVTGIIDFSGDTGNILAGGAGNTTFLNNGLISTSFAGNGSDFAQISADLVNNGSFDINNGSIILFNDEIVLNGGVYDIAADGIMDWDAIVEVNGVLTGNIQGQLNLNDDINLPGNATFDFGGTENINWAGSISGTGTLTNNNKLLISNSNCFINSGATLVNNDLLQFSAGGDLIIGTNGNFINDINGVCSIESDAVFISVNGAAPRLFTNNGALVVNLPNPSDNATIVSEFLNNNGLIDIQSGILNFDNGTQDAQKLLNGNYNIQANGTMDWDDDITLEGTLNGQVDGPINWRNVVWVNIGTSATFDFQGIETINWVPGSLEGGGTLINTDTVILNAAGTLFVRDGTTFDNQGIVRNINTGSLQLDQNGTFNNLPTGTLEFTSTGNLNASGVGPQFFNNQGLVIVDSPGTVSIGPASTNSGTIDIRSGELEIPTASTFHNQQPGIIMGTGTLDLPSQVNFTNDGTISPGASPGVLTILGDYDSSNLAVLEIELDGLNQGTEFDFIPITGTNVNFDGSVNVTLNFAPTLNDEFVISTTSGTINTCNLASPVIASFGGLDYEFSVICRNSNEVVLTFETLSTAEVEGFEANVSVYPNPAEQFVFLKNNSIYEINRIEIFDLQGRLIDQWRLDLNTGLEFPISLLSYQSGYYFLRISSGDKSITKQIIRK